MRKALVTVLLLGLVAGALSAAPAVAAKKKKTITVSEEFALGPHAPIPVASEADPNGCRNGQDAVHKTTIPFTTPAKGIMTVEISEFQGDWDLYLLEGDSVIAASDASQIQGSAASEQIMINLGAKKNVSIVACNWAGGPTAAGSYTYKYKK
jgi:hypothetical protein